MKKQKRKQGNRRFGSGSPSSDSEEELFLTPVLLNTSKTNNCIASTSAIYSDKNGPRLSPVLLSVGNDGEAISVVSVAADVRVPPGHPRRRRVVLWSRKRYKMK